MAEYEKRFVAFIDILGFKDAVNESAEHGATVTPSDILQAMVPPTPAERGKLVLGDVGDISECNHRMNYFSDCVAISTEATHKGLFYIIMHAEKIARKWLEMGFLCRGAICLGAVYHDENNIFGPAFIKAYQLEKEKAIYARIILDESVRDFGLGSGELKKLFFSRLTTEDKKILVPESQMDNLACQSISIESDDYRIVHVLRVYLMIVDCSLDNGAMPPDDDLKLWDKTRARLIAMTEKLKDDPRKPRNVCWFMKYFDYATGRGVHAEALKLESMPFPAQIWKAD